MKASTLPSIILASALQFAPLSRMAAVTPPPIMAIICRAATFAAAAMGGIDAVSGATLLPSEITSPLQESPLKGVPFSLPLTTAPYGSPYWTADGLPDGLTLQGAAGQDYWTIAGTPAATGHFLVNLTAYNPEFNGPVSATLVLSIADPRGPPIIDIQPSDQEAAQGSLVTFAIVGTSPSLVHYQWRKNGIPLPNQTNATMTIPSAADTDAGTYSVILGNDFGSVTSRDARLVLGAGKPLRIASIENAAGATLLRWNHDASARYDILASKSPGGPWTQVASITNAPDGGGTLQAVIPSPPDQAWRFYRLQSLSAP